MDEISSTLTPVSAPVRSSWRAWLAGLAAILLLSLAIYALVAQRTAVPVPAQIDPVQAKLSQLEVELEALRVRLKDAQAINQSLRAQSFALTQRVGLVEDALTSLRRDAAPAAEAFKLDEAESLLGLAQVRLELFSDPDSAQRAVELADAMLSRLSDPRIAMVRQTLAIELDVLRAAPRVDLPSLSGRLRALSEELNGLPIRMDEHTPDNARGRIAALFDRYLVVRREGEAMPTIGASAWAVRQALKIEFERAQLALERQQPEAWSNSLKTALELSKGSLLTEQASTQSFLSRLSELSEVTLAAPPPPLGASLRELRRMRSAQEEPTVAPLLSEEPVSAVPLGETPSVPVAPAEALPESSALPDLDQPVPESPSQPAQDQNSPVIDPTSPSTPL